MTEETMTAGFTDAAEEKASLAKTAARAGTAVTVWVVLRILFDLATFPVSKMLIAGGASDNMVQIVMIALSAAGVYIVATPIALWILGVFRHGGLRAMVTKSRMPAGQVAAAIPIMYAVTILINLTVIVVSVLQSGSIDEMVEKNPFLNLPTGTLGVVLNYIWMVLIAPVYEEILFRGGLLGTLKKHGNWFAVIVSGILFGLAHLNIAQMLYATALGILLGMMYVRSGSVVPCIIAHIAINFLGITIATFYSANNLAVLGILALVVIAAIIAGIVLGIITLVSHRDKLRLGASDTQLSRRGRFEVLLRSPLFVLMFIFSLALSIAVNLPPVTEAIGRLLTGA